MGTGAAVTLFGSEQVERARRYWRPRYSAALANGALGVGLLAVLSFGAIGEWVFAPFDGWPWWAAAPAVAAITIVLGTLVRLPVAFWVGYLHEHAWGFSTQTVAGWSADRLKSLAVGVVLAGAALAGLVAAARAFPSWWPLVAAVAAAALVLLVNWAAPVVLEPLFNRARPLADARLATELRALADQAGVPVREVLVIDASRRTRKLNAYVSGLGSTRRVVLFDTLAQEAPPAEVRLVVAHELGHRRARHGAKGTALGVAGAVAFVLVLWAVDAAGWRSVADPQVIPFVLLLAACLEALLAPLGSALSRRWERQADDFSLALTGDPTAFESTHRRLALSNLADLTPPRLVYLAWFTHPTEPERILRARESPA
ncbi:MAG TPA: M48 family metalloprotease [Gaiellaceae bacterium]|nr:M48 family metalloprotease [Gaiellaceae bacterium]